MNGATLAEVAEALGHRTLMMMAKRYSHQSGEHVRDTLERMANRFLNDLGQQPSPSSANVTKVSIRTSAQRRNAKSESHDT
jgi:DNA-binding SARP family transcriptional activator